MILRLILRDRSLRRLLLWLPLAVLIGLLLAANQQDAVRHRLTLGVHGYQGFRYVAFVPWGALGLFLLSAGIVVRCERLDATLPLSYPALWLSRVLALVFSAWALVGTMAATLVLRNRIQGFEVVGRTQVGSLFAQLLAVSALAVVLARLPRAALRVLAYRPKAVLYLALAWLGLWGIVYLLAGHTPGWALLPGVVAVILGLWGYLSLPSVPLFAPQEPHVKRAAAVSTRPEEPARRAQVAGTLTEIGVQRWLVPVTIWRTCYGHWSAWLVFALSALLLPSVSRSDVGGGLTGPNLLIAFWLVLSAFFGVATSRLHLLDALPISRKRVFACAVLPGLLVVSLGYLGATALRAAWERQEPLVDYRRHPVVGDVDARVPLAFWEVGWQGDPPPVDEPYVPPWEEPYYPWSVTLCKGFPAVLYSPYHVPEGSSPAQVAGQLSRAVEAVYGVRIPADELEHRYLSTAADGGTTLQAGGLTLLDDYPDLKPTSTRSSAPLGVLFIGVPWLLYLALTVRGGYIRPAAGRRPLAPLALAILLVFCLLSGLWSYSAGYTAAWKLNALYGILARKLLLVVPGGPITWWGIAVLLHASAYLLAQARFERVEAPAKAQDRLGSA